MPSEQLRPYLMDGTLCLAQEYRCATTNRWSVWVVVSELKGGDAIGVEARSKDTLDEAVTEVLGKVKEIQRARKWPTTVTPQVTMDDIF